MDISLHRPFFYFHDNNVWASEIVQYSLEYFKYILVKQQAVLPSSYLAIFISIKLSVYLSFNIISVQQTSYQSLKIITLLSLCLFIFISIQLAYCLSIFNYLSNYLYTHILSMYPTIYLSIQNGIYLLLKLQGSYYSGPFKNFIASYITERSYVLYV